MSDKLVEALRTIIKQEVISELDARQLNQDDQMPFSTSQVENIKDIVKDMMGGEIEFTIEVHT